MPKRLLRIYSRRLAAYRRFETIRKTGNQLGALRAWAMLVGWDRAYREKQHGFPLWV